MPEENTMSFDFTGAPPVTGMPGGDRIAPGTYLLAVKNLNKAPTKAGKPMVTATFAVANDGAALGKKVMERFVFPRADHPEDSDFALRRWHGFLVACGMKERKGKLTLNLDTLLEKELVAEVDDETVPASGEYPERTQSRPMAFYRKSAPEAKNVGKTAAVAAVPASVAASPAQASAMATQAAEATAPAADDFAGEEPAEATAPAGEEDDLFADLE